MKVIFIVLAILTFPSVYSMIPAIFSPYSTSYWEHRGPFISLLVILITMSSIYLSNRRSLKLLNFFTITAFAYTFFNLITGNRGYFITFIISCKFSNNLRFNMWLQCLSDFKIICLQASCNSVLT